MKHVKTLPSCDGLCFQVMLESYQNTLHMSVGLNDLFRRIWREAYTSQHALTVQTVLTVLAVPVAKPARGANCHPSHAEHSTLLQRPHQEGEGASKTRVGGTSAPPPVGSRSSQGLREPAWAHGTPAAPLQIPTDGFCRAGFLQQAPPAAYADAEGSSV